MTRKSDPTSLKVIFIVRSATKAFLGAGMTWLRDGTVPDAVWLAKAFALHRCVCPCSRGARFGAVGAVQDRATGVRVV